MSNLYHSNFNQNTDETLVRRQSIVPNLEEEKDSPVRNSKKSTAPWKSLSIQKRGYTPGPDSEDEGYDVFNPRNDVDSESDASMS